LKCRYSGMKEEVSEVKIAAELQIRQAREHASL